MMEQTGRRMQADQPVAAAAEQLVPVLELFGQIGIHRHGAGKKNPKYGTGLPPAASISQASTGVAIIRPYKAACIRWEAPSARPVARV